MDRTFLKSLLEVYEGSELPSSVTVDNFKDDPIYYSVSFQINLPHKSETSGRNLMRRYFYQVKIDGEKKDITNPQGIEFEDLLVSLLAFGETDQTYDRLNFERSKVEGAGKHVNVIVFQTVAYYLRDYMYKYRPALFGFSSSDHTPARNSLYNVLINKIESESQKGKVGDKYLRLTPGKYAKAMGVSVDDEHFYVVNVNMMGKVFPDYFQGELEFPKKIDYKFEFMKSILKGEKNLDLLSKAGPNMRITTDLINKIDSETEWSISSEAGWTPLLYSIKRDKEDMALWLLDNGADPSLKSPAGNAALKLAQDRGIKSVIKQLDPKYKEEVISDGLERAIHYGEIDIEKYVSILNIPFGSETMYGSISVNCLPLTYLAKLFDNGTTDPEYFKLLEKLLGLGANPNKKDMTPNHRSFMDWAKEINDENVKKLMIKAVTEKYTPAQSDEPTLWAMESREMLRSILESKMKVSSTSTENTYHGSFSIGTSYYEIFAELIDDAWKVNLMGDEYFSFMSSKITLKDLMSNYEELFNDFMDVINPEVFIVPLPEQISGEAITFEKYNGVQEGNAVKYTRIETIADSIEDGTIEDPTLKADHSNQAPVQGRDEPMKNIY